MDLGSTNGTFLNGERIDSQRYYELLEKVGGKGGGAVGVFGRGVLGCRGLLGLSGRVDWAASATMSCWRRWEKGEEGLWVALGGGDFDGRHP